MNRQMAERFKLQISGDAIPDIEHRIKTLSDRISKISTINEELREDPRKALCAMKETQLERALGQYAKIKVEAITIERAVIELARCQAFEEQIRSDIEYLQGIEGDEKDLEKQLAIAKEVLAEKTQPGGRA